MKQKFLLKQKKLTSLLIALLVNFSYAAFAVDCNLAVDNGGLQTNCNADGSYQVCVDLIGINGVFEVVDYTGTATSVPGNFTIPLNGPFTQTVCLTYPNNTNYDFSVNGITQAYNIYLPCDMSLNFNGYGLCCEIACDDGICTNGIETWDATLCECVDGTPYQSCSGSTSQVYCDDYDPCTENDVKTIDDCDGSVCVPCAGMPVAACYLTEGPIACDDYDPCTENDTKILDACTGEICVPCAGTPVAACYLTEGPIACDDYDPCTENDTKILDACTGEICVPCAGTPVAACYLTEGPIACNDYDPCTENDTKILDACTGEICVPCAGTPIPDCSGSTSVVYCDDYDECTSNDVKTIDDCDGSICVPCAGTPSCDGDTTPPVITLNWGTGAYSGIHVEIPCDDPAFFSIDDVIVSDNCDDDPTITFTDEFIEHGDCNTDGYLSKWYCYWKAIDECGNESIYEMYVTFVCPPCDDYNACTLDTYDGCDCVYEPIPDCGIYQSSYCTYPPEFYGDLYNTYGGQSCSGVVNSCLSSGAITLGLDGQSVTVNSTDCIAALLPSYGGVSQLPPGNVSYAGACGYTQPLANALAAHLLTLKLNILNNPDVAYVNINNQIGCLLAPESVLQECGGNYTVGQLCIIGDHALGGYYGANQSLLNDIYIAICLVNDGMAFCGDPCVYIREKGNEIPVKNINTNFAIDISPNPASNYIQIAMNLQQDATSGSVRILHSNGQELLSKMYNGIIGYHQVSLDVRSLPAGIYFVAVQTDEGEFHLEKIMKL